MNKDQASSEYASKRCTRLWDEHVAGSDPKTKKVPIDHSPWPHEERKAIRDGWLAGYKFAMDVKKKAAKRKAASVASKAENAR